LLLSEEDKTLKITPEAHAALSSVGLKTETFSDIILRLVQFYKEHQ
jgi:predicted CopG family antitoxin